MWRENYGQSLFKVFLNPKYLQRIFFVFLFSAHYKFSVPSLMVSFTRNSHSSNIGLASLVLYCLSSPNHNDCSLCHTNASLEKQTQLDQPIDWSMFLMLGYVLGLNSIYVHNLAHLLGSVFRMAIRNASDASPTTLAKLVSFVIHSSVVKGCFFSGNSDIFLAQQSHA